jgi:hypothetical protein
MRHTLDCTQICFDPLIERGRHDKQKAGLCTVNTSPYTDFKLKFLVGLVRDCDQRMDCVHPSTCYIPETTEQILLILIQGHFDSGFCLPTSREAQIEIQPFLQTNTCHSLHHKSCRHLYLRFSKLHCFPVWQRSDSNLSLSLSQCNTVQVVQLTDSLFVCLFVCLCLQ